MRIKNVKFKGSYPGISSCPKDNKPEFAFIGRSNVGKSSLINMLCDRKEIARVSKKPGKTQLLNFYLADERWYIVDLPGYGYAKISKKIKEKFDGMIRGYLAKRDNLQCAFVLVDANIPPQKIDVDFINWMGEKGVPFVIIYTKTDRLTKNKLESNLARIRKELLNYWEELPQQFLSSSSSGRGKEEILGFIQGLVEG